MVAEYPPTEQIPPIADILERLRDERYSFDCRAEPAAREIERLRTKVEELERVIVAQQGGEPISLLDELDAAKERIEELDSELNNHRQFVSWLTDEGTEYGEEFDTLLEAGLIVEVKPTPEFIDEWGDSPMYVLAWKAHEFEEVP